MPENDAPEIEPLQLEQHVLHIVKRWPKRTSFMPTFLAAPHVYGGTLEGDVLTLTMFNGSASYRLTGEEQPNGAKVAELVDGSNKLTSRRV